VQYFEQHFHVLRTPKAGFKLRLSKKVKMLSEVGEYEYGKEKGFIF